jgi:hypothetical protein
MPNVHLMKPNTEFEKKKKKQAGEGIGNGP